MALEKKYPADIKIPQDSESLVKFLYSKEIDAELYSYLLSISVGFKEERISAQGYIEMVGHTVIYKQNMPTGLEMAEHLTPKGNSQKVSKATANRHFKKLMDYGYIKKEKDYYEILNPEDSFLMVPLDTINFLLDNLRPHVFKTFIYLVQRNKFKENYEFTLQELAEHTGLSTTHRQSTNATLKNALLVLNKLNLVYCKEIVRINREGIPVHYYQIAEINMYIDKNYYPLRKK